MKWICSQIGAREHYAIPRVLHRERKLECLYTDLWAGTMWRALGSFLGRPVLSTRYHRDLADAKVESFDLTTLVDSSFGGNLKKNPYEWFLYVGSDFGRSIVESLKRKKGINWKDMIFFGYDTGFLEPAKWVKERGGKAIVCQMDPSRFEVKIVKEEENRWPGWAKRSADIPETYFQRREKEWDVADLVMVNSEWSGNALLDQGVAADKIVIVPLAYEAAMSKEKKLNSELLTGSNHSTYTTEFNARRTLRILFLGQVILRKGIQYLIEAARLLQNEPVSFDIVGPIGISDEAMKSVPPNVFFHGPISRDMASGFFSNADLFVLPTLSDGFALTQLEAMAHGLPVISTPHCGRVVTDGIDGVVVPSRDANALSETLLALVADPRKLQDMSEAASKKVRQFSLQKLADNLADMERTLSPTLPNLVND